MLATRAIVVRTVTHLRLFHTSVSHLQEWPQNLQNPTSPPDPSEALDGLADAIDNTPSTHRGASTLSNTSEPHEIFNSWDPYRFYSPLDFLRSRRIRVSHRQIPRSVGPGAKEAADKDVFRQLDIDPVEEANNSVLLSAFMTGMGKIRPRAFTGLSWRSQRRVAQAIKRAKQKGVIPILSRPRMNYVTKSEST